MRSFLMVASVCALALSGAGCTGLSMGENRPGADTYLELGAIAVDPATEVSFVLQTEEDELSRFKTLYAIDPDSGAVSKVKELTGYSDIRILFPDTGVCVMAEKDGQDELHFLSHGTWQDDGVLATTARYHGTRMAPSRRFIAVADNNMDPAPIHVIDSHTRRVEVVPHGGQWLEAMWANGRDRLVAIVFHEQDSAEASARLLVWDISKVVESGYATTEEGLWADATLDVKVPDVSGDFLFSFTWVGISPDDAYAVFPVRHTEGAGGAGESHELLVLDLVTGDVRSVPNARGPVGFTPDGSTIVSYRYAEDAGTDRSQVLLVDVASLDEEVVDLPWAAGPQYFITREGSFVVIASSLGSSDNLVIYDADTGESRELEGARVGLHEFVSRVGHGELWLIDDGLHRLDFMNGAYEAIPLPFTPRHVNILPTRDRLVMDDRNSNEILFYDLTSRSVTLTATLPAQLTLD